MKIAVAKGDGIGEEIMQAVLRIFNAAKVPLEYVPVEMGKYIYDRGHSTGMTAEAKNTIESLGILFKGPMETPKGKGVKSINVTARKVWNTYANKRNFKSLTGVESVFSKAGIPINITIIRENIEDTYGGIEHKLTPDVALCRRFVTRPGSLQVHRYAFETARRKGAHKVTCGHKANIMKMTDGIFLETFYETAKDFPDISANDVIVDDLAMKLVVKPNEFDILVLPNLQGDIISDLCAGLVGGLGFAPSANIGDNISIFEAVHGTAPDIAGKNIANPTALLMSGIMMLRHIGLNESAAKIENALLCTLEQGIHTSDFGKAGTTSLNTTEYADAIINNIGNLPHEAAPTMAVAQDKLTHKPPVKPAGNIMKESRTQKEEILGVDFFIESNEQPRQVARKFLDVISPDFELLLISNRGTQVWPTGSIFTECIDQYQVRVLSRDYKPVSQEDILREAVKTAGHFKICSLEMLMNYDGVKSFSLAQGQ